MKFLHPILLLLLVLTFAVWAVGEDNSSVAEPGSFVTLKQSDGSEFRVFGAGPTDAKAAVFNRSSLFRDSEQESERPLNLLGNFDFGELWALNGVRENDWIKLLGWPGYRVNRHEIDEPGKILKLWARRKGGNRKVMCSGCGRKMTEACNVYQREVCDLPRSEYRATVLIELYRVRCPDCGVKNGENSAVAQQGTVQPAL